MLDIKRILEIATENTEEALTYHENHLGHDTDKNKAISKQYNDDLGFLKSQAKLPEMDQFTALARRKISYLIKKDGFTKIVAISNESVYLDFEGEGCKVDGFGKVEWQGK